MSRKQKTTTARSATPSGRQRERVTRRRQRAGGVNPLVWLAGFLAVVVALVALNVWQSGALAKPAPASRAESPAELQPLAQAIRPLRSGHDMARIPAQTPAPQPPPKGMALPRVELPSSSHDFGRIPKQLNVTHIFAVQNTGTADLVLSNLVTSCGCTTAETTSSVIPPGQRADLAVTFDPDFHPTEGETVRLVWFATNDPTQPWIELRITADVEP